MVIVCTGVFCQSPSSKNNRNQLLTPIEQINSLQDVDSFLNKYIGSPYNINAIPKEPTSSFRIRIKEIQDYFKDSLEISSFLKEDLDKDGNTDLLINTIWRLNPTGFVILNKGNGEYKLKTFINASGNRMNMVFIKPGKVDGMSCLNYFLVDLNRLFDSIPFNEVNEQYKTGFLSEKHLVYKFGQFIEYNRKPSPFSFQIMDYKRGGFFPTYTKYRLKIYKNRNIYLQVFDENKNLNDPKTIGTYSSKLSVKEFKKLRKLASYINLSGLDNKYDINRADIPWAEIKLTGKDFKNFRILDRGLDGTYGLKALYQYFDSLYKLLNWEPENDLQVWSD